MTGPWEYFSDKPLSGATIIIDEIHNFCGSIGTPKSVSNQWQKWLGELGHNQAVFRCLSQSPEKVHSCIKQEAQASYTILNTGLERDPYFKIEIYDWLEIWAGIFGGNYRVFVFEQESKKVEGRKKRGQRTMYLMGPPYFGFYDSFNAPISNEQTANVSAFRHEYEKHLEKGFFRGRLSLLRWFVFKHFYQLSTRVFMAVALVGGGWWLLHGGMGDVMGVMMRSISGQEGGAEVVAADSFASRERPTPEETRRRNSEARTELEIAQAQLDDVRLLLSAKVQETEELQAKLDDYNSIVLMTPDEVVFLKGRRYGVRDILTHDGPHKGAKVIGIDFEMRRVFLDDGGVMYMRD